MAAEETAHDLIEHADLARRARNRASVMINQEQAGEASADCADEVVVDLEAPLADWVVVVNDEHRDVRDPQDPAAGEPTIGIDASPGSPTTA